MSAVSGAAERKAVIPVTAAPERSGPSGLRMSNSLKDMSISEVLKLAEERTKMEGMNRRLLTDNPWHKRMIVSDNVTRNQSINRQRTELDNNDKFFDNLLKKMIEEKFIPDGKENRKRTRLCNKESSNGSDKLKRQKKNTINTKFIPPRMVTFTKRLLPRLDDGNLPSGDKIRSQYITGDKKDQERHDPRYNKSNLGLIQEDKNTGEVNPRFEHFNSSMATLTTENSQGFYQRQTENDSFSISTQRPSKLEHNRPENGIGFDPIYKPFPGQCYAEKYPEAASYSPVLSTIEEYHQLSMIVESPVLKAIDIGLDMSVCLTPPIRTESSDCEACNMEKYDDYVDDDHRRLLSPAISFGSYLNRREF